MKVYGIADYINGKCVCVCKTRKLAEKEIKRHGLYNRIIIELNYVDHVIKEGKRYD